MGSVLRYVSTLFFMGGDLKTNIFPEILIVHRPYLEFLLEIIRNTFDTTKIKINKVEPVPNEHKKWSW